MKVIRTDTGQSRFWRLIEKERARAYDAIDIAALATA